jgi:hypothetical protein
MAAKSDLRRSINEMTEERNELKRQIDEAQEKIVELQQSAKKIDGEKRELEEEKATKQRAQGEYRALPTKLGKFQPHLHRRLPLSDLPIAQLEEHLAAKRQSKVELMAVLMSIHEKIDLQTVRKCELGLEYAVCYALPSLTYSLHHQPITDPSNHFPRNTSSISRPYTSRCSPRASRSSSRNRTSRCSPTATSR